MKKLKIFKQKKLLIIIIIFIILLFISLFITNNSYAKNVNNVEDEISNSVSAQLEKIDFNDLNDIVSSLQDDYNIFGSEDFKNKVVKIIKGEYFSNYNSLFQACLDLAFSGFVSFMPLLLIIIAIALVANIVSSCKPELSSNGVHNVINFVCFSVVVVLLAGGISSMLNLTSSTLNIVKKQMNAIFPLLLTMLTAVGGIVSVGIYKPIMAILSGSIINLFSSILYPIFIFSFIFAIIGNLTSTVKLNKFSNFIASCFKWLVGFIFTIFTSFLTIQGISAGKYDGISVKTAKFAIKSYVPIVGGYLSDGVDFVLLSSVLIKNAIGVAGLILICSTLILPIIKIVVFKLGLQFVSSIVEPIGDGKISVILNAVSKIMIYPIIILLCVAFMYIISVALCMCTANIL